MSSLAPSHPTPVTGTTVCATYERVSTVVQSAGLSLSVQAKDAEEFARDRGWHLPEHLRFRDGETRDASGADWNLPGLRAMLDAARRREFTILVTRDSERFARSRAKALVLKEELLKHGVRVVHMNLLTDDTPEGRFMDNIMSDIAELDRERRALLTSRHRWEKAERGIYVGNGPQPYGYQYVYQQTVGRPRVAGLAIVEEEADILRQLFQRAQTESMRRILFWLDTQDFTPPGQSRGVKGAAAGWSHSALAWILKNRLYAGRAQWGGLEITVPAIIDPETFDRVQDALHSRRQHPGAWTVTLDSTGDPFLLRGRLICGCCSTPDTEVFLRSEEISGRTGDRGRGKTGRTGKRYYICRNKFASRSDRIKEPAQPCALPSIRADLAEERIWTLVMAELLDPERIRMHLTEAADTHQLNAQRLRDRLQAIDTTMAQERKRMDRIIARLNSYDPAAMSEEDQEEAAAHERDRDRVRQGLGDLRRKRDTLERELAQLPGGLSPTSIDQLTAFTDDIRRGGDFATPAERRRVLDLLHVQGRLWVNQDDRRAEGYQLETLTVGVRPVRTAAIHWTAEIALRTDSGFLKRHIDLSAPDGSFTR